MKNFKKILAVLLCLCCLFFVGCDKSDFGGGGSDDKNSPEVISVDGMKVLSKPVDYDFENAVGGDEMTTDYYNLLAREILRGLYLVYEDVSVVKNLPQLNSTYFSNLDESNNVLTFTNSSDANLYYLYDSIRYTIKEINSDSNLNSIEIVLDSTSSWNWNIDYDAKYSYGDSSKKQIIFLNAPPEKEENVNSSDLKNLTFRYDSDDLRGDDFSTFWRNMFSNKEVNPSFSEVYFASDGNSVNEDGSLATKNHLSPFYYSLLSDSEKEGDAPINYYQDALEYAIYMTVLGFDFEKDAEYFDFQFERVNGRVDDILVGGWGNNKVSISKGENPILKQIKDAYKQKGNFIGITQENKAKIIDFIKKKILGGNAYSQNTFQVKFHDISNGVKELRDTLTFNRNYDQIIDNILEFACTQAPIGRDENGELLRCDQPYLVSEITDYSQNQFFADYSDEDSTWFVGKNSEEYQSIVIYPTKDSINKMLGDVNLVFEYFGDAADGYGEYIDVVVGLRYYDHTSGKLVVGGEDNKYEVVKRIYNHKWPITDEELANCPLRPRKNEQNIPPYYGMGREDYEEALIDSHWLIMNDSGTGSSNGSGFGKIEIKEQFKQGEGDNAYVINPFVFGTVASDNLSAKMLIQSNSKARNFYKLNKSSQNGSYGTLNEAQFYGDGGCDFLEVYFDIQKQENLLAKTKYDFKIAFLGMNEAENVF